MTTTVKIRMEQLTKVFGEGESRVVALQEFTLSVDDGEFVSIVGPSGCGKTTVLRIVAGLEAPTEGRLSIEAVAADVVTARAYFVEMECAGGAARARRRTARKGCSIPAPVATSRRPCARRGSRPVRRTRFAWTWSAPARLPAVCASATWASVTN